MNCNLSPRIRADILLQAQSNVIYENIVENIACDHGRNISEETITKIKDKYEETESLINKPKSGRPKLLSPLEKKAPIRAVEKDPKLTAVDIYNDTKFNESHVSIRTLQYLLKAYGLKATTTQPLQLPQEGVELRLDFANKYVKEFSFWPKISQNCLFR